MSSTDAATHEAQYLIHFLQNTAPTSLLVTLRDSHTAALRTQAGIFKKDAPRARPLKVVLHESQRQHQPIMAYNPNTIKTPDHAKPLKVPIVEAYP